MNEMRDRKLTRQPRAIHAFGNFPSNVKKSFRAIADQKGVFIESSLCDAMKRSVGVQWRLLVELQTRTSR